MRRLTQRAILLYWNCRILGQAFCLTFHHKADAGDPFIQFSIVLQSLHYDFESRITFFFEEDKEVIRFRFLLITPGKEGAKTPQPPTTDKTKKKKSRAYMQDIESLLFFYVDMYILGLLTLQLQKRGCNIARDETKVVPEGWATFWNDFRWNVNTFYGNSLTLKGISTLQ